MDGIVPMDIRVVPNEFRPACNIRYPAHQAGPRMEEYVCGYFFANPRVKTSACYLPIFWDNYLVNHRFGRDIGALQQWYDEHIRTDPGTQYWTVCEYADGIKIDASPNLHVFYCACDGGTTLPLLCDPHPEMESRYKYLATFCGSFDTHPVRRKMRDVLRGDARFCVVGPTGTGAFCRLMHDSKYALCPRGYGPTSYRLYEAIQMGCVPVYIYDDIVLPYQDIINWNSFCVMVHINDVDRLPAILDGIPYQKYQRMRSHLECFQELFTMKEACVYIKACLEKRWPA